MKAQKMVNNFCVCDNIYDQMEIHRYKHMYVSAFDI